MPSLTPTTRFSRWPHRWAWLLACATFPLVWWGGFVTATGSGMAFKDWLTSDGVFMPLYPWLSAAGDKFIEHGHRLLGMLSGFLTIALLVSLFVAESRRWVRLFGVALLLGVVVQGVLGGLRVKVDQLSPDTARLIALIHGCTGPMFFAATAAMVAVTSRRWAEPAESPKRPARLLRLATLTALLAYLQLVVGAVVRHSPLMIAESAAAIFQTAVFFHVVLAIAVTAHLLLIAHKSFWSGIARRVSLSLALLVVVQLLLGVSSWMLKYGMPQWATSLVGETGHFNRASDAASAAIVTAHGAVGSLLVALSVVLALHVGRQTGLQWPSRKAVALPAAGVVA